MVAFEDRQFSIKEAIAYLTISESFFHQLVRKGELRIAKLGTRTLVSGAELRRVLKQRE
jgi:excisionase family DNA binding protein